MPRKFDELKAKMSPDARRRADAQAHQMMADMLLAEIRQLVGLTQEELASKLGIKQPTLSRMESQDDMYISTLQRVISALGGTLELIVRLPEGDIRIKSPQEASSRE